MSDQHYEPTSGLRPGHAFLFACAGIGGALSLSTAIDLATILPIPTTALTITGPLLTTLGAIGGATIAAWIAD